MPEPTSQKIALLVGVSQYGEGLEPIPAAPGDVEAMRRVLQDPKVGGFDVVQPLIDPDPIALQIAIEELFANRRKEDLTLLFFSGHGLSDDNGRLYLATRATRRTAFKSTSVSASFLHDLMNDSRSQRQVVILDCCYSGAFASGWQQKGAGTVQIKEQLALGGKGRAVLTSSSAVQLSFSHEGAGLYTRYLVKGLETGAADLDGDGTISVRELHEYAQEKVQADRPGMKPEFYPYKEGFNIILARSPLGESTAAPIRSPLPPPPSENIFTISNSAIVNLTGSGTNQYHEASHQTRHIEMNFPTSSPPLTHLKSRDRLERERDELQQEYDFLSEEIQSLSQSRRIEDLTPKQSFKLDQQIKEAKTKREAISQQLQVLEEQL